MRPAGESGTGAQLCGCRRRTPRVYPLTRRRDVTDERFLHGLRQSVIGPIDEKERPSVPSERREREPEVGERVNEPTRNDKPDAWHAI